MMAPKAVTANQAIMSEEIKREAMEVKRSALWNREISDEAANVIIGDFNERWIAAGGIKASTIVLR
jgi:hypothetical protein